MRVKVLGIMCALLLVGICVGCGNNSTGNNSGSSNDNNSVNNSEKVETKGNCNAVECVEQIEIESTVEEINEIIGFDGELIDEDYNIYYWEFSEDTGIKVAYYSSTRGTITLDIDKDSLANKKVDFSRYDELQPKIKEGITYDEFIKYIGNVDGIVTEKSSLSTKYTWVDSDGSYLTASFSNNSKKCSFASGWIK